MATLKLPKILTRFLNGYVAGIETLLILGMVCVVVVAGLQVFFRYVVGASLSWSEELLRYTMIWITYLGAGLAYSRGEIFGMNMLVNRLPTKAAALVIFLARLLVVGMMAIIIWYGWIFAWTTRATGAVALPLSMFWLHISVVVGAVLLLFHVIASALASRFHIEAQAKGAAQ